MRTPFTAFMATIVWLITATLSYAAIPQLSLPLDKGENVIRVEAMVQSYDVGIRGQRDAGYKQFRYDPSQGPFRTALAANLPQVSVNPPQGFEGDEYRVLVYAYSDLSGDSTVVSMESAPLKLARVGEGWELPDVDFQKAVYAEDFSFFLPTVTDWEASIWQNGLKRTFSTKVDLREFSPDERGCEFLAIRSSLRQDHLVVLPPALVLPDVPWERLELTLWEGERETVQTFERTRPLRLAVLKIDGDLAVAVTGDGAHQAAIEESLDGGRTWGESTSLLSPPTLLSDGERRQTVRTDAPSRIYRARRDDPSLQKLSR